MASVEVLPVTARDFVARSYFGLLDDPPTSIGAFQSIEQDLCRDRDALLFDTSQDVLRTFLVRYFSDMVVSEVLSAHTEAQHSSLGIEYFLRGGFGLFGLRVLADVLDTLAQIGADDVTEVTKVTEVEDLATDDSSWTEVTPRRSTRIAAQSSQDRGIVRGGVAQGRGGRGGRDPWGRGGRGHRGRGGRGQRDRGGGRGEQGTSVFFGDIRTVDIWLPAFVTPEKGAIHRKMTIRERSTLFQERVIDCVPDLRVYDPFDVEIADVTLYHGFRSSSWDQFRSRGIDPLQTRNEFSSVQAFYGSSLLAQAFEHPLHNHPRLYAGDLVSILVFKIPVDILHGDRAPPDDGSPFAVKWFEHPDLAWQTFCEGNLFSPFSSRAHGFDIVIGPSCLPLGERQVTVLEFGDHGERRQPTQVAFCSRRAMTWLNTCAEVLLRERRYE